MLAPEAPAWMPECRAFIMRGTIVDLAASINIGAAFAGVASSLVKDVFHPLLGLLMVGVDFSDIVVALNGQYYASVAEAPPALASPPIVRRQHRGLGKHSSSISMSRSATRISYSERDVIACWFCPRLPCRSSRIPADVSTG